MKCYEMFVFFLLPFFSVVFCSPVKREVPDIFKSNDDTLLFAHVIYRHGDRNIENIYPNDPYKDESHWPGGIGALTNKGKMRHFKLGQFFRRRYDTLIGDKYSANKVYIQSSNVDRTIMSALANLAGLFPPNNEETWNEDIQWQPIPVHTIPKSVDRILYVGNCDKYNDALRKYIEESPEIQRIYSKNVELFSDWSQKCGLNINTTNDVYRLYNTLQVEREHNKTLPEWAVKAIELNGTMENIALFDMKIYADTPQMARLSSGFLLKEMLERFSQKIDLALKPDRTLWFYSTHFFIMTNLLNSLGLLQPHMPQYAASLHFELYKSNENEHYLQLFYKNSDDEHLLPLNITKCGEKCPLNQFYELFRHIIPGDFDIECRLQ